jgi:hypothetical protein
VVWRPTEGTLEHAVLADVQVQLAIYRDHLPVDNRTVMYTLMPEWVGPDLHYADKDELQKMVVYVTGRARRARIIPFDPIADPRTSWDGPNTVADLPHILDEVQVDRQAGQPWRVEVWVETKGNVSRLARVCTPYGVDVYSGSGSVPISANRQAALRIIEAQREHAQPTLLLVAGDYDPAGLKNIAAALHDDVLAFVHDLGGDVDGVVVRHLAITSAMAEADDLRAKREYFRLDANRAPRDWPLTEVRDGVPYGVKVELEELEELDAGCGCPSPGPCRPRCAPSYGRCDRDASLREFIVYGDAKGGYNGGMTTVMGA